MSAEILAFPNLCAKPRGAIPKRDRRRKLPAGIIDLSRVIAALPGDHERDVDHCTRNLAGLPQTNDPADPITGLAVLIYRGGRFSTMLAGSARYDTDMLVRTLYVAAEVAERYDNMSLVDRALNPDALLEASAGMTW